MEHICSKLMIEFKLEISYNHSISLWILSILSSETCIINHAVIFCSYVEKKKYWCKLQIQMINCANHFIHHSQFSQIFFFFFNSICFFKNYKYYMLVLLKTSKIKINNKVCEATQWKLINYKNDSLCYFCQYILTFQLECCSGLFFNFFQRKVALSIWGGH